MKIGRYCIYLLMMLLFCWSCSEDDVIPGGVSESDCMSISVSVPLAATRAPSEDVLNEFKVSSLHLYFFASEEFDEEVSEYLFDYKAEEGFDFSRNFRIELPENALKAGGLFGETSNTCRVYAVANVEEGKLTPVTVGGLKSVGISSDFDKTVKQDMFAMDGVAELNLDRDNRIVTGRIELQRAASKLTLSIDLPESMEVEETVIDPFTGESTVTKRTYTPHSSDMHIWMANGVKESILNTEPLTVIAEKLYSNNIDISSGSGASFVYDESQPVYKYIQEMPFYSYPNRWDPYSPSGNSYMTLVIPWEYADNSGVKHVVPTYYRLAVQPNRNYIERNTHYDMRIKISRLGGVTVQEPVDMLINWNYAMQWNTQTLATDIKEISYLLLNNNNFNQEKNAYLYEMNNEEYITIPFNSSHTIIIDSVTLTWHDYKNDKDRTLTLTPAGSYSYDTIAGYDELSDFAAVEIDEENSMLKIKRSMLHIEYDDNGTDRISDDEVTIKSGETAINSYTITVNLKHKEASGSTTDVSEKATVVVTQTPAIYITSQANLTTGHRFVNNNNTSYSVRSNRVTYYYGYTKSNGSSDLTGNSSANLKQRQYYLGSINNTGANKNTYIINISKLSEDDKYIIGDPRVRSVNNLGDNDAVLTTSASWSMTDDNKRNLTYYYPTDESTSKKDFIAPQLRIASQWGITSIVYKSGAKRRCASYQENGRPAGRWRLPTISEIEFICKLSNKGYIPYLFGEKGGTADYWCATGAVDVDNDENNPSVTQVSTTDADRRYVRCVYDEWYWGADTLTNKKVFHWGDEQRVESRSRSSK